MSRKLEAWLRDGLEDLVGALESERTADEARAVVAAAKEEEAAAEFGRLVAGSVGSSTPDDDEEAET